MSNFECEHCSKQIIDTENGYITGCNHYPVENSTVRKEYIARLIAKVRKQIEEDPETVKAKEDFGEEITIARWLNVSILCSVIEDEVINNGNI